MKKLDVPQSGSQADSVASRNRFGQYNRTRAMPTQPRTPAQVSARGYLTDASQAWRELTDAVRASWNAFAATQPRLDSLGQTIYPTGHQLFVGWWASMTQAGLATPPALPSVAPDAPPIIDTFTVAAGPDTLGAEITATVSATHVLIVAASGPVSAGVSYMKDLRFIQRFTALTVGAVDFSAAYTAKFGALPTAGKIFLRCTLVTAAGGVSAPAETSTLIG
jgi:hypothetical protein